MFLDWLLKTVWVDLCETFPSSYHGRRQAGAGNAFPNIAQQSYSFWLLPVPGNTRGHLFRRPRFLCGWGKPVYLMESFQPGISCHVEDVGFDTANTWAAVIHKEINPNEGSHWPYKVCGWTCWLLPSLGGINSIQYFAVHFLWSAFKYILLHKNTFNVPFEIISCPYLKLCIILWQQLDKK